MIDDKNYFSGQNKFSLEVKKKEMRKLDSRSGHIKSVWLGFGSFGLIGWSIVLPTVAGILMGIWLDKRLPVRFSWTLTLLFAGILKGCLNAWRWIQKEDEEMKKEHKKL